MLGADFEIWPRFDGQIEEKQDPTEIGFYVSVCMCAFEAGIKNKKFKIEIRTPKPKSVLMVTDD